MAKNLNPEEFVDKIQFFCILILCFIFSYCIHRWFAEREQRINLRWRSLIDQWRLAQKARMAWEEEHCYQDPWVWFSDPHYQELWNIEIGAEELYLICLSSGPLPMHGTSMSWTDYNAKKKMAESDRTF